jgi:hypothetical protein
MLTTAQGNLTIVGASVYWKGQLLQPSSFIVRKYKGQLRASLTFPYCPLVAGEMKAAGITVRKVKPV